MPQFPLIVFDDAADVSFYRSVEDVARDLEPIDVRNGEFQIYDSAARPLELQAETRVVERPWNLGGSSRGERVLVKEPSSAPELAELMRALNVALDHLPAPPQDRPSSLASLIELTLSRYVND